MAAILGAALFLPLTYGVYTASERFGGLLPSIGGWASGVVFLFFVGCLPNGEWPDSIDGRKPKFFEGVYHYIKVSLSIFFLFSIPSLAILILSYGWKLVGVAPLSS